MTSLSFAVLARCTTLALTILASFGLTAFASDSAGSVQTTGSALTVAIDAHPAIWVAHGKRGTVYLLGSVHLLPPGMRWRTPDIEDAIAKADVFAFEIPSDETATKAIGKLVNERGRLPPGESLRAKLSPEGQEDLDKALALDNIPLLAVDRERPWLAMLTLAVVKVMHDGNADPRAGLDKMLADEAVANHKELRYMETIEQQFGLVAGSEEDSDREVKRFEAELKEFLKNNDTDGLSKLLTAWASGDPHKLDALFNDSLNKSPKARKVLLDDRNKAWVETLRTWLDGEDKVFLVTVGAGHLVGKHGVPTLLRNAGYRVDGP